MLAAVEAGVTLVEYTPAEIKRAVVGYGRAEKRQVQQMVKLLLGLAVRALARTMPPTRSPWQSATCTATAHTKMTAAAATSRSRELAAGEASRTSGDDRTSNAPTPELPNAPRLPWPNQACERAQAREPGSPKPGADR